MELPAFVAHLHHALRADSQPTDARTFPEAGYDRAPYGVVLRTPTGAYVYWQGVITPPLDRTRAAPQGPPPAPFTAPLLPTSGLTAMSDVEHYTGAVLTTTPPPGLRAVDLYADRPTPGSVPYGLTATFYDTTRIYLYARHMLPPGRAFTPGDAPFRRRDHL